MSEVNSAISAILAISRKISREITPSAHSMSRERLAEGREDVERLAGRPMKRKTAEESRSAARVRLRCGGRGAVSSVGHGCPLSPRP